MLKVNVRGTFATVVDGSRWGYSTICRAAVAAPGICRVIVQYARYAHRVFWVTPIEYESRGWEEAEDGEGNSQMIWVPSPLGRGNVQRQMELPPVSEGYVC